MYTMQNLHILKLSVCFDSESDAFRWSITIFKACGYSVSKRFGGQ